MSAGPDVVAFVEGLARDGVGRFRPSYVAARTHADVPEAHAVLDQLARTGMLEPHFELICPHDECHRTIARYDTIQQIPLGQELECPYCNEPFVPDLNHVWVYYTPSRELLLRVNRERAGAPEESLPKVLSWIQRKLRRPRMTDSRQAGG